ncbi:hypothetical protein SAMN05216338_10693 [Bradyrhizobium sp. Rc2d]|uniref:hypothetical protein n=1 Tax=Bradyrhizobium sp. Rc2d TaxID=1855321 RepID=UPI00088FFE86|nr:hypothetical protein [Bradyrhizobium sp. Rc2d]SDJ84471.1 hypothetical protein SAMN05216338_10693 [Bradyrhizobium sp. Rc2d]
MSGHLRFYFASLVLVGVLSGTPAFSNPFAELFNITPREPAPTSPAQPECLGRPGNSPPDGQHWVYRMDGHRKCWFLAEGLATVKKPIRRRAAKDQVASLDDETVRRSRSAVVDARPELLRSAPAEGSQPPLPEIKVADGASELGTVPAPTSAAPIPELHSRLLTPEHSMPSQVDVEQLLAVAPVANDAVPSPDPPAMVIGLRIGEARDEARSWTATWLGVLLMTLGGLSILSSSRTLRQAVRLGP